ncbi:MAG: glycoside hydrolase family 78 protein [Bacteroidales bacterium]|jgi:hypothetical protein|nr:glycoside hydrolase family 78 protein [Bacteroidales bacterium]
MKTKNLVFCLFTLFALGILADGKCFSHAEVYDLKCEQASDPLSVSVAAPRFSWKNAGSKNGFVQSAYRIMVYSDASKGKERAGKLVWDSGKVLSSSSVLVPFGGTGNLEAGRTYFWKVRTWDGKGHASGWSHDAIFRTAVSDWHGAKWITLEPDKKDEIITNAIHQERGARKVLGNKKTGFYKLPLFRKEFNVSKPVRKAYACVSGLGQFDFFVNGAKVSDHFLDPGWTKYDKNAQYVVFDVTDMLDKGSNALGVMLGNGFFNIPRARYFKILQSYGAPRLKMMLTLEYEDGSVGYVTTGQDWKTAAGPVTFSSIYGGEDYDSELYRDGWADAGFDDGNWYEPLVADWKTKLEPQNAKPLKIIEKFPSVRHFKNAHGWIYDLGVNSSAIVSVEVSAGKPSPVKMEMAELLDKDSLLYLKTNWNPYYCIYTPKANSVSVWQPRFTYYGFRYVEVTGAVPEGEPNPEGLPVIKSMTGLHTSACGRPAGTFRCSNDLFNRIDTLIDRAVQSNTASILTDCPQREKLGWLEQDHLMQYSLLYGYDLSGLYTKIMEDIRIAQNPNGMVPTIAPEYVVFKDGFVDTPEWGSTFIISPWYYYIWYGDDSLIKTYYKDMKRYVSYLSSKAVDNIVAYGLGDWYDIGPNPNPGVSQMTSNGVSATAIYYYDVCLMEKMARLQGLSGDAASFEALAKKIKAAFNARFWNPVTRKYDRDSQAANAMALFMGLVTDENKSRVLDNLIADIRARGNALTAGDVGYRYVVQALEDAGRSDVIFDMNSRSDVPGYGWQLSHGATALTETWQAMPNRSNNHLMLGHLEEWLYSGLGGIRPDESGDAGSVGWKHFFIAPQPAGDITSCKVTYESPYGDIVSSWKITEGEGNGRHFRLSVTIPPNSSAMVFLPGETSGKDYGSGSYVFQSTIIK